MNRVKDQSNQVQGFNRKSNKKKKVESWKKYTIINVQKNTFYDIKKA